MTVVLSVFQLASVIVTYNTTHRQSCSAVLSAVAEVSRFGRLVEADCTDTSSSGY